MQVGGEREREREGGRERELGMHNLIYITLYTHPGLCERASRLTSQRSVYYHNTWCQCKRQRVDSVWDAVRRVE